MPVTPPQTHHSLSVPPQLPFSSANKTRRDCYRILLDLLSVIMEKPKRMIGNYFKIVPIHS